MNDSNPKALTFGGAEHRAPLADISHLPEEEKTTLINKASVALATYDYAKFNSDEEFELALACVAAAECINPETADKETSVYVDFHRSLYYHKKKYRLWKKEVLDPMVKDLADYALGAPQYDASFLLELEKKKMECMDAYFSHSVTANSHGNYPGGRWLRLCIKLLSFLVNEDNIPENIILAVNPRNIGYPVSKWDFDHFFGATEEEEKIFYGRRIYWHKAHRLYCGIRQHALHTWWD